ncbi:MAG TPA: hypothetical protein DIS88_13425 [Prevotella sp.]|nr:hypothetical protein [Prevotella sp.]
MITPVTLPPFGVTVLSFRRTHESCAFLIFLTPFGGTALPLGRKREGGWTGRSGANAKMEKNSEKGKNSYVFVGWNYVH